MKKVYLKPTSEIVVLNLGEPVAWGELANPSNDGIFNEAREQVVVEEDDDFFSEKEKAPLEDLKFSKIWAED